VFKLAAGTKHVSTALECGSFTVVRLGQVKHGALGFPIFGMCKWQTLLIYCRTQEKCIKWPLERQTSGHWLPGVRL